MRKIFLVIFVIFTFFACDETKKEIDFTVEGMIENGVGKIIVLTQLTSNNSVPIDTVEITGNGKYLFGVDAKSNCPEFYALSIVGKRGFITFVGDSLDKITINSDTVDFAGNYTVEGSKDSKLLKELDNNMQKSLAGVDSLKVIYRERMGAEHDKEKADAVKNELDKIFMEIYENHRKFLIKFIDENPSSLTSIIALSQQIVPNERVLDIKNDKQYFEKVDKSLFALYPNSKAVSSLHDFLQKRNAPKPKAGKINIGDIAPEISLPTPAGEKLKLSSLKGDYVLIDFWASWCKPCRIENPTLTANYKKYKSKGFTIFQVSLDKIESEWNKGIEEDKLAEWHHVSDLLFWDCAPAAEYGVRSIPSNFLINPEGKVIAKNLRGEKLGAKLSEIYKF